MLGPHPHPVQGILKDLWVGLAHADDARLDEIVKHFGQLGRHLWDLVILADIKVIRQRHHLEPASCNLLLVMASTDADRRTLEPANGFDHQLVWRRRRLHHLLKKALGINLNLS